MYLFYTYITFTCVICEEYIYTHIDVGFGKRLKPLFLKNITAIFVKILFYLQTHANLTHIAFSRNFKTN